MVFYTVNPFFVGKSVHGLNPSPCMWMMTFCLVSDTANEGEILSPIYLFDLNIRVALMCAGE